MKYSKGTLVYCIYMLSISSILSSCSPSREELAQETFQKAVDLYSNHQYNSSKILLDSIIYSYPEQKVLVHKCKDMMNMVYRTEQERNLQFLDSLLSIRESEVAPIMKYFQEENPESANPTLISKRQSIGSSFDRALIKAHTDKNGNFFISSHYTGEAPIHHFAIKAEVGDIFTVSDTITDDALNHAFNDGGTYWETIRFKNASDNGVGEFIANHSDEKIRISLITPKGSGYKFMLTEIDKQAIRETYYLATLLRETIHIKGQIRNVRTSLKYNKAISNSSLIKN
ncbi:MAG: hypothetical protein Q4C30_07630 [Bacteroidia bacterium]|nr:hypothetical protein [Bacteroidia bacterium]